MGRLTVDTAFGGDTFVIVNAPDLGFSLDAGEAADLCTTAGPIVAAANAQFGIRHPEIPDIRKISFCLFTLGVESSGADHSTRHACVIRPGKVDRSPTGTGVSARMAVLHARGIMKTGDRLLAKSIIDSEFVGRVEEEVRVGETDGIIPSISGRAWITGTTTHLLDPTDPYPGGYRVSDTWPAGS